MGDIPRVLSLVYNEPLLITFIKLQEILQALDNRTQIAQQPTPINTTQDSPVAIISVEGTLTHKPLLSSLPALSGLRSYQSIHKDFDAALADPAITAILFNINSNGGQVNGCFDLVDHIYAARGIKPIYAISNEAAFSAAYAIASAADRVCVTRTAGVGSIGVIAMHTDISALNTNKGIKYTPVYAGKYKNSLSPLTPLNKADKAFLQARVNTVYDLFVATVARNRNIPESQIRATEAKTYYGRGAIDIGLADAITTYGEVTAYLGESNMDELLEAQNIITMLRQSIQEDAEVLPSLLEAKYQHGIDVERQRVANIIEKCLVADDFSIALDLITRGISTEDAGSKLLQLKVETTQAVSSAIDPTSSSENPLIANAEKRMLEFKSALR